MEKVAILFAVTVSMVAVLIATTVSMATYLLNKSRNKLKRGDFVWIKYNKVWVKARVESIVEIVDGSGNHKKKLKLSSPYLKSTLLEDLDNVIPKNW